MMERAQTYFEPVVVGDSLKEIKERVSRTHVCIVIPPSPFLTDERVFPFLGPLKIAAELEGNGNPVEVLDLSGYENYLEILKQYCQESETSVFGLTATTPQVPNASLIAQTIKKSKPDSRVLLGGPHVTLTHTAFQKDRALGQKRRGSEAFEQLEEYFDQLIIGDGELSIFAALDDPELKIIDAASRHSPLFLQRGTLEEYAYPARHLIDLEGYRYYIEDEGVKYRTASVIAQLGCPFKCGFCGGRSTDFLRLTRTREVGDIVNEVREVVVGSENWEEPVRGIMFYDDELNVSIGNLEGLCKGLIVMQEELDIEMRFRGFVKAELFTSEQAELMYQAGFRVLLSGVESGSDKILAAMQKNTTREVNKRCVEIAHQAGLRFKALMSIGHPGETKETIEKSINWILGNLKEGDEVDWTVITQYPGSPYFDESIFVPEANAWLYAAPNKERLWSQKVDYLKDANYYKGIPGEYKAFVWTDSLSPENLVHWRDHAEKMTREALRLPQIETSTVQPFEHSMGQSLPGNILRISKGEI